MVKVSVIIPFYNQNNDFLIQALTSALNQTLNDIEIICINDGSENLENINLVKNIQKQDNRVKLINIEHQGSGIARNNGIIESSGKNIMFLDSDDYYPDIDILEKLYNIKTEEKVKIAGGKHLILNKERLEEPYFNFGNIDEYFCNKKIKYLDYQFPWWYWCFMYDTDLMKENNIFFPSFLRYQDPPFFVKIMYQAQIFYAADFVTYIHRKSDRLFSLTPSLAYHHVKGISEILTFSKEHHLNKLHKLLYDTFYNYDINLLENIKNLSTIQLYELIKIINNSN